MMSVATGEAVPDDYIAMMRADRRFPAIAQPEMKVFPSVLADRDRRLPKPTGFEQRLQPGTATA